MIYVAVGKQKITTKKQRVSCKKRSLLSTNKIKMWI